jgi:uncharacterized protein YdcH (DUF465 family)
LSGAGRNQKAGDAVIEKHDLIHEFPEHRERIHDLKTTNAHFARLFAEYHEVDHQVHRIETGAEAACDERLDEAKRKRLTLKDELYEMILTAKAA